MVDPYREQNPNRRIWSFIGTGKAGNSRIDRIYVNTVNGRNITNIKYLQTPFNGHRVLSFVKKDLEEKGKGYYKLNTSILKDRAYKNIVEKTMEELDAMQIVDKIQQWETFLLTIKSKSLSYSQMKSKTRRTIKDAIIREIQQIEQNAIDLKMDEQIKARYDQLTQKNKEMELVEIEGYKTRVKYLASYDKAEPDIAFYSKIEKKNIAKDTITQLAEKENSKIYTDTKNILRISSNFYSDLYTPNKVDIKKQDRLLKNIKNKITKQQKDKLDAQVTVDEVKTAVFQMQPGKSPGLDGIPVEFYQEYWENIKDCYMAYINKVKTEAFSKGKNTSIIKLIYKKKGAIFFLKNYRPISLINVDIKILSKVLANRLKYILPSIIHESQTAVYGRKIDQTIHLIRDLIDLANKEDEQAAFIFIDQEKAFDRVNHDFLYKTMRAFGIGEQFITWVVNIYSNATSVVNINGFFTNQIPLNRGVRQGCPLSALLYVMVVEVLALQLRLNPNIVGFTIFGEKIVSAHYMDDATIVIKQNRCFKEVIKELTDYEEASGAKVNYDKTKGLWSGNWKNRRVSPMKINWTNKNVENLGVFFGNSDPASLTYTKIMPSITKRLNYWKQFKLSKIGKARVVDIFLISKLNYAFKFYPIPLDIQRSLQKSIFEFINFPNKTNTISQEEMWKTKLNGGIKLINLQLKSGMTKAKWLIEMATESDLKTNLNTFSTLMGTQKGQITGRDIIVLPKSYYERHFETNSHFYREALLSISQLEIKKGVKDVKQWDTEHIFYNPLFTYENGIPLVLTRYCKENNIYKYEQLLEEKRKQVQKLPYKKKFLSKICVNTSARVCR